MVQHYVLGDLHCGFSFAIMVLEEIFPKEEADLDPQI